MKNIICTIILISLAGSQWVWSQSTELTAGEITFEQDTANPQAYTIIASKYLRTEPLVDSIVIWADGSRDLDAKLISVDDLCGPFSRYNYKVDHVFTSNLNHSLLFLDKPRQQIKNLAASEQHQVRVQSWLNLGSAERGNSITYNTPPPFFAQPGELFTHHTSINNESGDSLSYTLPGTEPAEGYFVPDNMVFHSRTGEIQWNSPTVVGKYQFLVLVNQFENGGVLKGSFVRNFVIEVRDDIILPQFKGTEDWPIEAGHFYRFFKTPGESINLSFEMEGDASQLQVEAFGDAFDNANPPIFTSSQVGNKVDCNLSWVLSNADLRERPYVFTFAGSSPSDSLCARNDLVVEIHVVNDVSVGNLPGSNTEHLTIFPNPFQGETTVEVKGIQNGELIVFDITGKPVMQLPVTTGQSTIKISGTELLPGIYFCTLSSNSQLISTKKMIHLQ